MFERTLTGTGRSKVQDHQPGEVPRLLRQDDVYAAGRTSAGVTNRVGSGEGYPGGWVSCWWMGGRAGGRKWTMGGGGAGRGKDAMSLDKEERRGEERKEIRGSRK